MRIASQLPIQQFPSRGDRPQNVKFGTVVVAAKDDEQVRHIRAFLQRMGYPFEMMHMGNNVLHIKSGAKEEAERAHQEKWLVVQLTDFLGFRVTTI